LGERRVYSPSAKGGALRQSEILGNVTQAHLAIESVRNGEAAPQILPKVHPFAVVMTQDCDLEQDFNARTSGSVQNMIPSVLLCEAEYAEALLAKVPPGKDIKKPIAENRNERYHILDTVPAGCDASGSGIPQLGIDFKRLFTIPTDELYLRLEREAIRRCYMESPYLENLGNRFSRFIGRVALPNVEPPGPATAPAAPSPTRA
jgi:hypothetical protein